MNMRSLIPSMWNDNGNLRELQREVERVFSDFSRGFGLPAGRLQGGGFEGWAPRCDVSDDEKTIYVTAELPGVEEKDVELSIDDSGLVITGEKKTESRDEKKNAQMVERSYGYFSRRIPLGFEPGAEDVKASFKNGVLSVSVPKPKGAESRGRRVEIKAG